MTATPPITDGPVIWSTAEPILDRDAVLDLFWADRRCQTVWVNEAAGTFRVVGEDGLYRIRISWSVEASWEVVEQAGPGP